MVENKIPEETCIFCENIANSPEHLFADWFNRKMPLEKHAKAETVHTWTGVDAIPSRKDIKKGKVTNITVKVVCTKCNNEWMSRIEERASIIFKALMKDKAIEITDAQINTIAIWASLKMLVVDASLKSEKIIPDSEYSRFASNQRPLNGISVHIGRYIGSENNSGRHIRDLVRLDIPNTSSPLIYMKAAPCQSVVHVMGNVVVYALWKHSNEVDFKLVEPLPSLMPEVWPLNGVKFEWPRAHIGDRHIDYLARALNIRYPAVK